MEYIQSLGTPIEDLVEELMPGCVVGRTPGQLVVVVRFLGEFAFAMEELCINTPERFINILEERLCAAALLNLVKEGAEEKISRLKDRGKENMLFDKELTKKERIEKAIELIVQHGGHDGSHHKDWVMDQVVRVLSGSGYSKIVDEACKGENGPSTYVWDCGIAP